MGAMIDRRVIDSADMMEVSVGDYILSGGETAALTVMDAVVRLLPGVMGRKRVTATKVLRPGCWSLLHQPVSGMALKLQNSGFTPPQIAEWRQAEAKETQRRRSCAAHHLNQLAA